MTGRHGLSAEERSAWQRDGYLVRRGVFSRAEVEDMGQHGEALVADLVRDRRARRYKVGSYVFDPDFLRHVMIKWEGESDVVHGIEPFAHLSEPLRVWGLDPRLVDPMRELLDTPEPMLFTEKLNLKRPRHGGPNPLHQDYPYWVDSAQDPTRVATTIVYLDDATLANGCTWVVPGSHRAGKWKTREDTDEFGKNELDAAAYPDLAPVPLEVEAGATVTFGPFLVHQSTPNTSEQGRRALLYSYQPAGFKSMLDGMREMAAEVAARRAAKQRETQVTPAAARAR
ncbi:MAG TPA: phytanoyl-CoA dioxygenase family protein [Myxococcota bacterium]|nr:phytanoyl-CoA dioxygenase family protein [Myxococcota bacterium]